MRLIENTEHLIYYKVRIKRCRRECILWHYELPRYQREDLTVNRLISSKNLLENTFYEIIK
jgi:hypothetical protein